jgi:hypothetical protein
MAFFDKWHKKPWSGSESGLDPNPDWIPIQQQPGSGSGLNLDPPV